MTDRAPITLAIETSNRGGGVALQLPDGRVEVEDLTPTRRHDDALMPGVDRLCGRAGVKPGDLEVIGVSIGPGGFTGLRIAVITAKVLAHATGANLVAVPTASVVAAACEPGRDAGEQMLVCLASKRDTAWTQAMSWKGERWDPTDAGVAREASEIDFSLFRTVIGDECLPSAFVAACESAGVTVCEPVFSAEACLRETLQLHKIRQYADPMKLAPLYPREPEAVTVWRARQSGT